MNARNTLIYYNPSCSKSRQTLTLLHEHQVNAEVVEYLRSPPNTEQLKYLLTLLNLSPRELMRKGESEYQTLKLDDPTLTDQQLIQAMIEHPILIERPIIVHKGKAVIGRPPEKVLDLIASTQ